ncbi:HigA family addiction module antitoxin [Thiolapillus sp.]|uniref:HigA family addiction module antitoxin n=1 Tax=Thiolapillus sp. TaxID=2017437 RepID=UPI003AF61E7F
MTKFYMATRTDTKPIECSATTLRGAQREAVDHFAGGPPSVPIYVLELGEHPDWKRGEEPIRMYRCYPWFEITEDLCVTRRDAERGLRLEVKHPGELLREYYVKPRGMSTAELAAHLGESLEYTRLLLEGHRSITLTDAYHLASTFETSKEYWFNLQRDYNLRMKNGPTT